MKKVYHLNLDEKKIEGAKIVILTGDPFRVPKIANLLDSKSKEIAYKREFRSFLSNVKGKSVLITSTGIGGPSISIAIDELAQIGVRTFIRIGTSGAIQESIKIGDVIITSGAVRLDGASTHYAPIEYPAVSDYKVLNSLIKAAEKLKIKYYVGITASSDTFYPGQERYDSYSKYVIKKFQNSLNEWQKLNVLNYEMESSTLFTVCNALGLKAGCITGVIVNRVRNENIDKNSLILGEENAIKVGVEAVKIILGE